MNLRKRQRSRDWRLERLESRVVPSFVPFGTVAVGSRPGSVALIDVNGDNRLDLLAANASAGTVSVRLGNGGGAFTGRVNYQVGANPIAIVAGDFNRDGKADFAVANAGSRTVAVWLGNGIGGFSSTRLIRLGNTPADTPTAMVAADFNGDGLLDLAVAQQGGKVTLLAGAGNGFFEVQGSFDAGPRPSGLAVADLNQDGQLDLIVSNGGNTLSLLYGFKEGFDDPLELEAGVNPSAIAVGDFNRDGKLDLAVTNSGGNSVSIFEGDGFGDFLLTETITVGVGPAGIATADLDGNGTLDLLVSNSVSNTVSLLSGNGDGTFTPLMRIGVGTAPRSILLGDLNGDGKLDAVLASGTGSLITVLRNNFPMVSAGSLSQLGEASDTGGLAPQDVVLADMNSNGFLDAVVVNTGSNTVTIRYGDGSGQFGDGDLGEVTSISVGAGPVAGAVADVNKDGLLDILTVNGDAGTVSIRINDGAGNYSFNTFEVFSGVRPVALTVADLNRDGNLDLAVVNRGPANTFLPSTVSILYGDGTGNFTMDRPLTVGVLPFAIRAGDINGDGWLDLIVANNGTTFSNDSVGIYLNNGRGQFLAGVPLRPSFGPRDIVLGDFDSDGRLDLVTLDDFSDINFYKGDGRGNFTLVDFYSNGGTMSLRVADLNRDGHLDVVAIDNVFARVIVNYGNGRGQFSAPSVFSWRGIIAGLDNNMSIALGDIDRDGLLDIVFNDGGSNVDQINLLYTLRNSGPEVTVPQVEVQFSNVQQVVTLTAQVQVNGAPAISGTVTFTVRNPITGARIGMPMTVPIQANGTASTVFVVPAGLGAGSYNIEVLYVGAGNSQAVGTLRVNGLPTNLTLTSPTTNPAFGQPLRLEATLTITGTATAQGLPISFFNGSTLLGTASLMAAPGGVFVATLTLPRGLPAGLYTQLQARFAGTTILESALSPNLTINVSAPILTIRAANARRLFGQPNPRFTPSYVGLLPGDTPAVVTGLQLTTTATPTSTPGVYDITPSGATAPNYIIVFEPGILTVAPIPLVVTGRGGAVLVRQQGMPSYTLRPFGAGFTGQLRVATGDVDGDGMSDVIVARGPGNDSTVVVYSGADRSELARFLAYDAGFLGGVYVAAGDSLALGRAQVVVGPGAGSGPNPEVHLFDILTSTAVPQQTLTPFAGFNGGVTVSVSNGIVVAGMASSGSSVMIYDQPGLFRERVFNPFGTAFLAGVTVAVSGDQLAIGRAAGAGDVLVFNAETLVRSAMLRTQGTGPQGGTRLAWTVTATGGLELLVGNGPGWRNALQFWVVGTWTRRAIQFDYGTTTDGIWVG